jgi:hypothetical protein
MKRTRQAAIALVLLVLCAVGFGIYFSQNSHTPTTPSPTQPLTNSPSEPTPTASASPTPSPEPTSTVTAEPTQSPTTQTPSPTQITVDDNASNPKIICSTWESRASQRFSGNGSIVVAYYYPDGELEPTYMPPPQAAHLRLTVTNNNSIILHDAVLEFHYRTSADDWVTTKTALDTLGVQERRIVNITLANPALTIVHGTSMSLQGPHLTHNVTSYQISTRDFEMHAYGYASK